MSILPKTFSYDCAPMYALKVFRKDLYVSYFNIQKSICIFDRQAFAVLSRGFKQNHIIATRLSTLTGIRVIPVRVGFIRLYRGLFDKFGL